MVTLLGDRVNIHSLNKYDSKWDKRYRGCTMERESEFLSNVTSQ